MHRLMIICGVSFVVIFCCVWQHVQWIQMGRVLTQKELVLKDIQFHLRRLELKEASLSSLERIEHISREDLGLVRGGTMKIIYKYTEATKRLLAERIMVQQVGSGPILSPSFTTLADASRLDNKSGRSA